MKVVGHRGARGLAAENTLASIKAALDEHVDEIEIDARLTKDGQVILHHDAIMKVGPKKFRIKNHTLEELRAYKADVTLLKDCIQTINRKVRLMIEIKPREPVEPIVAIVRGFLDRGWEPSDFVFGSFSQRVLKGVMNQLPTVERVVIEHLSKSRAKYRARQVHTALISLNHQLLQPNSLRRLRNAGFEVYSYTINDNAQAKSLQEAGLVGVITDHPERITK